MWMIHDRAVSNLAAYKETLARVAVSCGLLDCVALFVALAHNPGGVRSIGVGGKLFSRLQWSSAAVTRAAEFYRTKSNKAQVMDRIMSLPSLAPLMKNPAALSILIHNPKICARTVARPEEMSPVIMALADKYSGPIKVARSMTSSRFST